MNKNEVKKELEKLNERLDKLIDVRSKIKSDRSDWVQNNRQSYSNEIAYVRDKEQLFDTKLRDLTNEIINLRHRIGTLGISLLRKEK